MNQRKPEGDEQMLAKNPEEICRLFRQYMAKGDLEPLLSLYDDQVVFLNAAGEAKRGRQELREELAPFASPSARF
jgi:ketosteroid isomerase-like protein